MNGVINILKPKGITSFDAVFKVRKAAKTKKVGHTGTLDPEASGVLPICIGKATKIIDYIMENRKTYHVTYKLGVVTDTYDLEGKILKETEWSHINEEDVLKTIDSFKGDIMQIPPMYSALKQNGVRLYTLARQGIEVEREARPVTIYNIEDIMINLPYISMSVTCSKGTYIRSLCYDIGKKLGVGATMTELRRTANGVFREEKAIDVNLLTEENIDSYIISIEDALDSFDKLYVNAGFDKLLINGVKVQDRRLTNTKIVENKLYRVYDKNETFLGLGKASKEGFKLEKLLKE
ncbi:tRNA pseudouridine synthase B [Clostridium cavendishii DSM 21758]|uniref:tRNA pseudouridine synthase B n=1 Tax=Clostridium cavendishii DSM 21758 TaxID=1121302 RepID=A0A1M6RMR6_9CLOT|nr:tRNA pseudouridine(55) synthase TruB [Clostridium cavendishii]SHK33734.1 tRNA pseudouridine synthase B [Clostridium cavendishii DSM 21758]